MHLSRQTRYIYELSAAAGVESGIANLGLVDGKITATSLIQKLDRITRIALIDLTYYYDLQAQSPGLVSQLSLLSSHAS